MNHIITYPGKEIIKGKKYDTTTAKLVAVWDNNVSTSDFSHVSEELYLKKTGEYFLYGCGGAMTKYAEYIEGAGGGYGGGYKIIPLSVDAAKEWAERHLTADEYEEIFGEVEE